MIVSLHYPLKCVVRGRKAQTGLTGTWYVITRCQNRPMLDRQDVCGDLRTIMICCEAFNSFRDSQGQRSERVS